MPHNHHLSLSSAIHIHGYDINVLSHIGQPGLAGFLDKSGYSSFFLLADKNVEKHCLPLVENLLPNPAIISLPPGETSKSIEMTQYIWTQLLQKNADRKSLLINLGGGVVSDIGGFAAATFKRGIDFINIPTTLLSMVDASIGGKTGIGFGGIKNAIGTFSNPKAVFVYPEFLKTLAPRQINSGFAEIIKHALISGRENWKPLTQISDLETANWEEIIPQSLQVKKEIVAIDALEKGPRKKLNFGHTIGHAIEAVSLENEEDPLLHGEAIAIGMICEAFVSHKKADLSKTELYQIADFILHHFKTKKLPKSWWPLILKKIKQDKKNERNAINCTLLASIGTAIIDQEISLEMAETSLGFYNLFSI